MTFENTKSLIRSCVVSTKKGLTIRQLERDFEDLVGSPIPFQDHGFQRLDLFLRSIPDTVRLTAVGSATLVEHVPDESVAGIASLVSRQKGKPRKGAIVLKTSSRSKFSKPGPNYRHRDPLGAAAPTGRLAPTRLTAAPYSSGGSGGVPYGQPARQKSTSAAAYRSEAARVDMQDDSDSDEPTRRARSVAPAGRRLLSTAGASLSISTSNLSGGRRPARAAPALCPQHRPPRVCQRLSCDALHVCRLYVDGFCPHGDAACSWGHAVASDDNQAALQAHQLQALPESELLWLVRALLRQTAPVSAEEYRSQLAVCAEYAADARCGRSESDCFQLHLCPRLAAGGCRAGSACRWSHRLTDQENVMVLLRLRCAEMSEDEVLARLARRRDDDGLSDSSGSGRTLGDTDSERESVGTDVDLTPVAAEGGAVGGACSPREASQTGVRATDVIDRYKNQETGHGLTKNGKTERGGSLGAADQSSERGTGASNGAGQAARASGPSQQTTTTRVTEQQTRAGPASGTQTDIPATPDQPPTKELTKAEVIRATRTLDVCHDYGYPSKCRNKNCSKLHLCRFYIAGICTYAVFWCSRGHKFTDPHNKSLLAQHLVGNLSEAELLKQLRAGYLARNPITHLERKFLLQICRPFQRGECTKGSVCTRVHICDGYLAGKCESSSVCGFSHQLNSQHNAAVVRNLGLYSLKANDIKNILEQPVTAEAMWESAVPKQQRAAASGGSPSAIHTHVGEQQTSSGTKKPAASPPSNAVSTGTVKAADASTIRAPATPAARAAPATPATPATPAAPSAGVSGVNSPAALAMAASAGRGSSREAAEAVTAASEGSQPAEANRPAEGARGAGAAVGRDGQPTGSGHGSGDPGSGGAGTGQPRESAQQTVESDGAGQSAQKAVKSDGAGQSAQKAVKSDGAGQSAQKAVKSDGVGQSAQKAVKSDGAGQSAQPASSGQKAAIKPATVQLPAQSSPAPAKTPANKPLTKEEMMSIARSLNVCRDNFYPSKCKRNDCAKLHLCRFFIACKCTYAIYKCLRSHHLWNDPHNARVLRSHKLDKLSEQDVFKALRDGYLAQNPVTDVERRFLVQMCRPHQRGFCKLTGVCTRMHICDKFIAGKCDSTCGLSHNLNNMHNKGVVSNLGLDYLTVNDIKGLLEKPVTAKEAWDSSSAKQQRAASSAPTPAVAVSASTTDRKSACTWGSSSQQPTKTSAAAGGGQQTKSTTAVKPPSCSQTGAVPRVKAEPDLAESRDSDDSGSDSDDSGSDSDDSAYGAQLCPAHATGRRCQAADCDGFHICGFYLANLCRRPDNQCPLGHSFAEAHNVRMMDTYGLLGGSPEHFQELLDQMTLRARITFSNEAEEKVTMCHSFNSPGGCESEDCCGRFHMCNSFLAGKCTRTDCDHSLDDEYNGRVREKLGLAARPGGRHRHVWATDRNVIELIRAKLGVKPGVYAAPEVVEFAAEETESTAENVKPEGGKTDAKPAAATGESKSPATEAADTVESKSPATKTALTTDSKSPAMNAASPAEIKSPVTKAALTTESKPPTAEAALTTDKTKAVTNGAKPDINAAKPTAELAGGSGGSAVASLPSVCGSLCAGRRCAAADCAALHVCPHFLAGACRRQHCNIGHRLDTERNRRSLQLAGRAVSAANHDALVRELYAAAANVRRSQVYAKLRICISHNHVQGCNSVGCPFIHICQRFAGGTCQEKVCAKSHSVDTEGNKKKLRALKLETAPVQEVLEMLRAVHGVRSVCK